MKLLDLQRCSHPVEGERVLFCDRQASLLMKCAKSLLVRIVLPESGVHFVWHNTSTSFSEPMFTRAFFKEDWEPILAYRNVHVVEPNEVFCFNGEAYYLAENEAGTLSIRQMKMFCSQKVIEQTSYYDFMPDAVEEVYLTKIYKIGHGKEFICPAWVTERDSSRFHISVFATDGDDMIDLLDNGLYLEEKVQVGETFVQHGINFQLLQDEEQKLYLAEVSCFIGNYELPKQRPAVLADKHFKCKCKTITMQRR